MTSIAISSNVSMPIETGSSTAPRLELKCWALSLVVHACALGALHQLAPGDSQSPEIWSGASYLQASLGAEVTVRPEPTMTFSDATVPSVTVSSIQPAARPVPKQDTEVVIRYEQAASRPDAIVVTPSPVESSRSVNEQGEPKVEMTPEPVSREVAQVRVPATVASAPSSKVIAPDLSANRPPKYPPEALRQRVEGTVMLRLRIATDGCVADVQLVDSSSHTILDRSAIQAVQTWRGVPGKENGQPIETTVLLPVRFELTAN